MLHKLRRYVNAFLSAIEFMRVYCLSSLRPFMLPRSQGYISQSPLLSFIPAMEVAAYFDDLIVFSMPPCQVTVYILHALLTEKQVVKVHCL